MGSLGAIKQIIPGLVEGKEMRRREAEGDVYNDVVSLGQWWAKETGSGRGAFLSCKAVVLEIRQRYIGHLCVAPETLKEDEKHPNKSAYCRG